jgi:amino acid adenylation domain-containing protein
MFPAISGRCLAPESSHDSHSDPLDLPFEVFADSVLEGSLIDRFREIAHRFASRPAIQDKAVTLTYAELATLVDKIAAATIAVTEGRGGPVILMLPPDANFVAAILGVLAAGRSYIPLDIEFPIERNQLIISEAGACAVIARSDLVGEGCSWIQPEVPTIDIHALPGVAETTGAAHAGPDDLAAIYYTSGSTGLPKGSAWSHRNLLRSVQLFTNVAHISCFDRLSLLHSPGVFASKRNIYCALLNGASLHILPPRQLSTVALLQQIRERGITVLHAVPALLRHIAEQLGNGNRLDSVRLACLGGDRVRWSDVDACRRSFSSSGFVYTSLSATEFGTCSHWLIDDAPRATTVALPTGRPAPGWTVTIVNDFGEPVPDGEIGDITIAGRDIALGYWDGATRRVRAFPSDHADPRTRIFNTGDRGRRRADGFIEFVGRKDQQVKLHGHRIEPAEVEGALTALPEVSDGLALVRRDKSGVPVSLVAYVALRPEIRELLPRHLQAMLARRLPRHMIPAQIYLLDELPRLPNLKVDRVRLGEIDAARPIERRDRLDDPTINKVAEIYETMLKVVGACADDSIESLGGDSLQAMDIQAELERQFGVAIPNELVESRPSIRQIARYLAVRSIQAATGTKSA